MTSTYAEFDADHENDLGFYIMGFWKAWEAFESSEIGLLLAKEVLPEFLTRQARQAKNSGRTSLASKSPISRFSNASYAFKKPQIPKRRSFS